MEGCKRRFKLNWLDEMPGLVYSPLWMEHFAFPVLLLQQTVTSMVSFVNTPSHAWHRKSDN